MRGCLTLQSNMSYNMKLNCTHWHIYLDRKQWWWLVKRLFSDLFTNQMQLMLRCIWRTSAPTCTIVCLCHPLMCRIALWVSDLWYLCIICTATNEERAHGSTSNCVKILTMWSGIWQGETLTQISTDFEIATMEGYWWKAEISLT
jgi:hypothetical protein